ncbi:MULTISPECIES: hypothetical protein [Paenibacillus]|uniref:hypothetical protein n=1 Tax=Paenibacillus TaxID=44249 RepID=UPI00096EC171|nr:hypothetical protein [Paenibacillus odorifer]OMD95671.1 hypothetical protein BSK67_09550 [Paenibacillus odorifer]
MAETAEMKGTSALLSSYPAEIAEVKGTFALFFGYIGVFATFCGIYTVLLASLAIPLDSAGFILYF